MQHLAALYVRLHPGGVERQELSVQLLVFSFDVTQNERL